MQAPLNEDCAWNLFGQITEGLAHIHYERIIHRDLNPNNIFVDANNDIKIGDFGLAKFLELDEDLPTDTPHASNSRASQIGTSFYIASEIKGKWPVINEKVDIYSLGVMFFELWHPFGTAMERYEVPTDLNKKGTAPELWVQNFPYQANILMQLITPKPSDRPSASEVLDMISAR